MDKKYIFYFIIAFTIIIIYIKLMYFNKSIRYSLNPIDNLYTTLPSKIIENNYINNIPNNVFITYSSLILPPYMANTIYDNVLKNPEFNFFVFDNDMCANFIENNFDNDVLIAFNNIKAGAYKADLWRYCILYVYGGVYMDIKFVLHYKLTDIINKYGSIFVKDIDYYKNSCKRGTFNGFMISEAKNPIFYDCIQRIVINYKNKYYGKNVLYPTGPCLLGYIIRSKYNDTIFKLKVVEGILGLPYTINDYDNNTVIISQYSNYRNELVKSNNIHYGELWKNRDIYR